MFPQPSRQVVVDLPLHGAKLSLDVFDRIAGWPPNHYGQHLLVRQFQPRNDIPVVPQTPPVIAAAEDRLLDRQSPSHVLPAMLSPGPLLIFSLRGPRSNTLTVSPYPVRPTTLAATGINTNFHTDLCAVAAKTTLSRGTMFPLPASGVDVARRCPAMPASID